MDAVKNEIIAGRSLREQDFKEFASVILLDEELSISLFESPQEAINKVVEVNGFSYRVIGVYTSPEAKGQNIWVWWLAYYYQYLPCCEF